VPLVALGFIFGLALALLCLGIWGDRILKYPAITGYLLLALLLIARFMYYLPFDFPPIAPLFEELMHIGRHSLLFLSWIFYLARTEGLFFLITGAALLFLIYKRSGYFINKDRRRLTYLSHMILCAVFISVNCIFDANDQVLFFCLATWLPAVKLLRFGFSANKTAVFTHAFLVLVFTATTKFDLTSFSIFLTAGIISNALFLAFYSNLASSDFSALFLAGLCVVQFIATILPAAFFKPADGVRIASGSAYGFCDAGKAGVYATLRNCKGDDSPSCLQGSIGEIQVNPEPKFIRRYHFFSRNFSGEMKHLVCFADSVQIGMGYTIFNGKILRENVLEIAKTPTELSKIINYSVFGDQVGQALAYDAGNDAIFYSSEWSRKLIRYDRKKKTHIDIAERSIYHSKEISHWAYGNVYMNGSLVVTDATIDRLRKSIFVGEILVGSNIYELDLSKQDLRRTYSPLNGGNSFVSVDEQLQRLYAVGTWGITAFDTATGRMITKKRLGFGVRTPVIDTRNNLLFIPVTYAGKIQVLDRISLETLGHLDIGTGVREAILKDGFLIASSAQDIFYWPVAKIIGRLQPRNL
jgi:hypothetical protein